MSESGMVEELINWLREGRKDPKQELEELIKTEKDPEVRRRLEMELRDLAEQPVDDGADDPSPILGGR